MRIKLDEKAGGNAGENAGENEPDAHRDYASNASDFVQLWRPEPAD